MSGYPLCESGCKIKRLLIKPSTFYHKKRGEKSEKCPESIIEDSSIAQKRKTTLNYTDSASLSFRKSYSITNKMINFAIGTKYSYGII